MSLALATPNTLTRAYASAARQLARSAAVSPTQADVRELAVGAVTMAVASVETYLNVFAQLWLDQSPEWLHRTQIERDLRTKKGLGRKIEEWPRLFFNQPLEFGSGPPQKFRALVGLRNRLMHFLPETQEFRHQNISIRGLIDISDYESLTADSALAAVVTSEDFVDHLLQLQGIPDGQRKIALCNWLGLVQSAA